MPAPKASSTDRTDLITILRELPDPRLERTRLHKFEDILVIAICSLLCGAQSFEDMELFGDFKEPWLRTFLELSNGIPSHDTVNPNAALDLQCFLDAFIRWTQSMRTALADEIDSLRSAVAFDGKALRRAIDAGESPKVIVNAWAAGNGLVLGQRWVDDRSNEPSEAR